VVIVVEKTCDMINSYKTIMMKADAMDYTIAVCSNT